MNAMRFCIKVVVIGKGNLEEQRQFNTVPRSVNAKVDAHLYVPADMARIVSKGRLGKKQERLT